MSSTSPARSRSSATSIAMRMHAILPATLFALLGAGCAISPPRTEVIVPELPAALFALPALPDLHDPATLTKGEAAEDAYRMFEHILMLRHQIRTIHEAHREAARIMRR